MPAVRKHKKLEARMRRRRKKEDENKEESKQIRQDM
jgi:hypothetical protein